LVLPFGLYQKRPSLLKSMCPPAEPPDARVGRLLAYLFSREASPT
jgi:hypothetical protein